MRTGRAVVLLGMLWAVDVLAAQEMEMGMTLQGARGRFIFEDATTSWMLLAAAQVQGDRWRLGVTVPGIFQNSSALSYVGGVPIGTGGPNSGTVAHRGSGTRVPGTRRSVVLGEPSAAPTAALATVDSGFVEAPGAYRFALGDPIVSAGVDAWQSWDASRRIGVQGFVKLPLASVESGVGTGAADFGAAVSASGVFGRTMLAVDVSHWIVGDLPDLALRDITGLMLGVGGAFGWERQHSLLLSGSVSTAAVARTEAPQSVTVSYGHVGSAARSFSVGATRGLSESVADWTVWVGWRVPLTP